MLHKLLTAVVALVVVAACSNTRVSTDYETFYDFSALQNFSMLPVDKKIYDNPKVSQLDVRRLGGLINRELAKRYRPVTKDQADFLVRYFFVVEEKMRVDSYNANFGFYRYGFGYRYGFETPDVTSSYYQQGSVIIDIVDAKTDVVVWRGVTEGRVIKSDTPVQRQVRLEKKLARLFSAFPPKR